MAGKIGEVAASALRPASPPAVPAVAPPAAPPGPPPIPVTPVYFLAIDGAQQGPYHLDALRQHIAAGTLTKDTLAWHDGMAQWAAASEVPEIARLFG